MDSAGERHAVLGECRCWRRAADVVGLERTLYVAAGRDPPLDIGELRFVLLEIGGGAVGRVGWGSRLSAASAGKEHGSCRGSNNQAFHRVTLGLCDTRDSRKRWAEC